MASYSELGQGDRIPTVGVLQKLRNRSGANLQVDGAFAPEDACCGDCVPGSGTPETGLACTFLPHTA